MSHKTGNARSLCRSARTWRLPHGGWGAGQPGGAGPKRVPFLPTGPHPTAPSLVLVGRPTERAPGHGLGLRPGDHEPARAVRAQQERSELGPGGRACRGALFEHLGPHSVTPLPSVARPRATCRPELGTTAPPRPGPPCRSPGTGQPTCRRGPSPGSRTTRRRRLTVSAPAVREPVGRVTSRG